MDDDHHQSNPKPRPQPNGTREEPGTLTQGAPVFPGSSFGNRTQKTPGWLVQDPTTRPTGDLIPTIGESGAHPGRGTPRDSFIVRKTHFGSICHVQQNGSLSHKQDLDAPLRMAPIGNTTLTIRTFLFSPPL